MIKYIGVVTPAGIPITCKTLGDISGQDYLTSLISALNTFSESIGVGKLREIDTDVGKLLIKKTKSGFIVVMIVSQPSDYFWELLT